MEPPKKKQKHGDKLAECNTECNTELDCANNVVMHFANAFSTQTDGGESVLTRYFAAVCPSLRILAPSGSMTDPSVHPEEKALQTAMIEDGVTLVPAELVSESLPRLAAKLADGADRLAARGWPCTFLIMYQEYWELIDLLEPTVKRMVGGLDVGVNLDCVCWRVDKARAERGFAPHRDRRRADNDPEPDDAWFDRHGKPSYVTAWVALRGAESRASTCLSALRKQGDPCYVRGEHTTGIPATSLPHVTCLTARPGDTVLLSHRVLHWANEPAVTAGLKGPEPIRVSASFAVSNRLFEPPALIGGRQAVKSVRCRYLLACCQMTVYLNRFRDVAADSALVRGFTATASAGQALLSPSYAGRVLRDAGDALLQEDDDEVVEAGLEAQLDAFMAGGEVVDDFSEC